MGEELADVEKNSGCDRNFFDCNICLDMSKEPVVTCCGHLYCWPCLYQWLQISDVKECPVCKGELTLKTVTPIYGRGNHQQEIEDTKKIPVRPPARRIESLRNITQMPHFTFPMEVATLERPPSTIPYEEIIRRNRVNEFSLVVDRVRRSMGVRSEQNQPSPAASRRSNEGSSVSDVDSADSRPPTRRRR